MKKLLLSTIVATAFALPMTASATPEELNDVGVAVNYNPFSGIILEASYPIYDELNVRGSYSLGLSASETSTGSGTEPDYVVDLDLGYHRLLMDYRPFGGSFFLSGGYAISNYKIGATASTTDSVDVTVGDQVYTASGTMTLNGEVEWNNGPTLSLGWGHSPSEGWGGLFEVGVILTGAPDVKITGSGLVDDGSGGTLDVSTDPTVLAKISEEEAKLKDDIASFDFLPVLQAGVTYRF